jgi:phosphate transport system substrate-binding protein
VGVGKSVSWPVGAGGNGNEGVALLIRSGAYSIGYLELAYAIKDAIPYGLVQNARGQFIYPSSDSGAAAANGVPMPADMRVSITDTPAQSGYPITGFSWIIVYQRSPDAPALKRFLGWVLTTGQRYAEPLNYTPVPAPVRKTEMPMLNSLTPSAHPI